MKTHTNTILRPQKPALSSRDHASRITHHAPRGFTLVELLVVISIMGILAGLILPALATAKKKAQMARARLEVTAIAQAINKYEAEYSKYPASIGAMNAATAAGEDFTYGTTGVTCVGPGGPVIPAGTGFKTPTGTHAITAPGNYQANNSEIMAVLLDMDSGPNAGHVKNPQRTPYLNATRVGNTTSPGVGPDGVYRDPWGNPYIITIDLNYDEKARDAFYRSTIVSAGGLNGLILNGVNYEANSPVMVWSAGPDKMVDPTVPANQGANKNHIRSWK